MTTEQFVSTTTNGQVGTITVRRPEALNALNEAVLDQLSAAIAELVSSSNVRVILLTGAGERAFIAGADIVEFVGASPAQALVICARTKRVTDALTRCPKPVIAVVNGFCLGAGFEIALACDLRIASSKARLGLPEIRLGIIPGGGGTVRLTKIAGASVARLLTMTGEMMSASRAFDLGILAAVHEPEALTEAAQTLASTIAELPPFALGQLKSTLNIATDADTETALQAEINAFALCFSTADKDEGVNAFLEKRKPQFTGS